MAQTGITFTTQTNCHTFQGPAMMGRIPGLLSVGWFMTVVAIRIVPRSSTVRRFVVTRCLLEDYSRIWEIWMGIKMIARVGMANAGTHGSSSISVLILSV